MQETGSNLTAQSLSIRFSTGGFSFSTGGYSKNIKFDHPDDAFCRCRAVCLCESDIWADYSSVTAEIDDAAASLFPSGVFRSSDAERIMKFNYPRLDLDRYDIVEQYIEGFDITNIFAVEKELHAFLQDNIPYATLSHTSTRVITAALKSSRIGGDIEVWALEAGDALYVVIADNGNLLMSNRYEIKSVTDILYYTGALFSHYKLSQQETPLCFCGSTEALTALKERVAHTIESTL